MLDKIRAFLYKQAEGKLFKNDDELFLYLILYIAISFVMVLHLFLYVFYLIADIPVLFWYSVVSISLAFVCFRLLFRKRYATVGAIISVESTVFIFASTFFVGISDYIFLYWFMVIVMQMIVPYVSSRIRAIATAGIWLCMMSTLLSANRLVPVYTLPENMRSTLSIFHANAVFFGIILELLASNFIRKTIQVINGRRMDDLLSQAHTDPLTGLYNRRYSALFFEDLKHAGARDWCVALLDIDNFKLINDTYGHSIGDKVLVQISSFIRKCLRKTDVVFRWGGEEFLLFLEGVDLDTAYLILEKLRFGIEAQEFSVDEYLLNYTVTIGVVPLDVNDISAGIDQCDKNMYVGKTTGKNQVVK